MVHEMHLLVSHTDAKHFFQKVTTKSQSYIWRCWGYFSESFLHLHLKLIITRTKSETSHAAHNIRSHAGRKCLQFPLHSRPADLHLSYPLPGCVCSHRALLEPPLRFWHRTAGGLIPRPERTQWGAPLESCCQLAPPTPRPFSPVSCYWSPSETYTSAPAAH